MRTLTVGQPLQPGVTRYDEMPEYNFRSVQLRDRALASCTGGDTTDRPSPY